MPEPLMVYKVQGPYHVKDHHDDPDTKEIVGPNGEEIALCCHLEANLLAASWEILEALEQIAELSNSFMDDARDIAREAIAKIKK